MSIDVFQTFRARMLEQCPPLGTLESYVGPILSHLNSYFYESKSAHENGRIFGSYLRGSALLQQNAIDLIYVLPSNLMPFLERSSFEADGRTFELIKQIFKGSQWEIEFAQKKDCFFIPNAGPFPVKIWPVIDAMGSEYYLLSSLAKRSNRRFNPFSVEKQYMLEMAISNGNLLFLSKAARLWAHVNRVPLGGFLIDVFAVDFIASSPYRKFANTYQDCLLRDYFLYLANIEPAQDSWKIPETQDFVYRSGAFEAFAEEAYHVMERLISNAIIRRDDEVRKAMTMLVGSEILEI